MAWADYFITIYGPAGEFLAIVGANILDGKKAAVDVDNGDGEIVCLDDFKIARFEIVGRADVKPLFSLQSSVLSLQYSAQRAPPYCY